MKRTAAALSLLFLCCSLFAQKAQKTQKGKDRFAGLDTAFARVLKDWHCAGFAVAVVEKDSVVYTRGFGYRNLEQKLPVTPHTLFAIGSCTKAFTSSLIGLLAKDGLVDIDKPVRNYLPALRFYSTEMDNTITLRDMMCHRTGLPRYDYSWYLFGGTSRDSILQRIQYMEPTAAPRVKWQYNNFMFLGQGMVVEKLTGKNWENNISERILKPLGMNETNFSIKDLAANPDASLGYGLKKDSIIKKLDYHEVYPIGPAGEINSNVTDMAAWVATWMNGGKYHGKEVLPAPYVGEAITAQMVEGGGLPSKESPDVFFSAYGFGWMLASYRGHYRVEHGGNIDGFSASTAFFPTDSIGIVVLTNQSGSTVPSIVRNLLVDRLLHLPYKDWNSFLKAADDKAKKGTKEAEANHVSDRKPGTHPSHPITDYTGMYSNPAYGSFEIAIRQDSLFATIGSTTWWLRHYHYDVFDPSERDPVDGYDTTDNSGGLKLQFEMNLAGEITGVSMPIESALPKPILFSRSAKATPMTATQLQKYVGDYAIGTVNMKVYLKGSILYLFVPGQPEYELANVGPDKFSLKALNGFLPSLSLTKRAR